MRDRWVSIVASFIAATIWIAVLVALGAPGWAAGAFGYLAFLMYRLSDKVKGGPDA